MGWLPIENRVPGERGRDFTKSIEIEWRSALRTCYFERLLLAQDRDEIVLLARSPADEPIPEEHWEELARGRTWKDFSDALTAFTRA